MFPSDIDLNDLAVASMETSTVKATIGATTLGRSPYFDWRKRRFIFNSGFNRECTLTESIQQHIRLFINTVKNKYAIYDRYFGVDTNGLVGYRLPRSVAIATIKRQISDDLLNDGTEIEVNENVYD